MVSRLVLPGITREQMIKVDELMEQRGVSLLLMMENAGVNLARLSYLMNNESSSYVVIVGSGGNGGGGLVAARRLAAWGCKVEIFLPKGKKNLKVVFKDQLKRAERMGVTVADGIPTSIPENSLILDCFLGYSFQNRKDNLTKDVFSFFRKNQSVISLDCPSGIDITTGENFSQFHPLATLTIAFVKTGLLHLPSEYLGDFYVTDIGVPIDVYRSEIGINWNSPFHENNLIKLSKAFVQDPIQNVRVWKDSETDTYGWVII